MDKKKLIKSTVVITLLLLLLLVLLLIYQSPISPFIIKQFNKEQTFNADDECSMIMGRIIHQIRDSDECHIRCLNECNMRELDYQDLNFVFRDDSCHTCVCYCK